MNSNPEKLLIVDDQPDIITILEYSLKAMNYQILTANSLQSAIEMFDKEHPHLVLTDINLGKDLSFPLITHIRKNQQNYVGIIAITGDTNDFILKQVFDLGADDFCNKVNIGKELKPRLKNVQRIIHLMHQMSKTNNKLQFLSFHDDLTGLFNMRYWQNEYNKLLEKSIQEKTPLSLVMFDLDNLKKINEEFNHLMGAECIKSAGMAAQLSFKDAIIARFGGDEFAVLLPNKTLAEATEMAKKMQETCQNLIVNYNANQVKITVSQGVAEVNHQKPMDFDTLMHWADNALFKAKREGKNRFAVFSETD